MEHIWTTFKSFVKKSLTEKFKAFFPGSIVGIIAGKSLFFSGLAPELVTIGAYVIKYASTCLLAFGSGLCTSFASVLVSKWSKTEEKNKTKIEEQKKDDRAA